MTDERNHGRNGTRYRFFLRNGTRYRFFLPIVVLLATAAEAEVEFSPRPSHALANGPDSIAIADFDEDGALDLATAIDSTRDVAVVFGDGTGAFVSDVRVPAGQRPWRVAAGDLDGDGHADIVAADVLDNTIRALRGDGAGRFSAAGTANVGAPAHQLAIRDLDADGFVDVLFAWEFGAAALFSDGGGGFASRVPLLFPLRGRVASAASADVDRDGNLDVVISATFEPVPFTPLGTEVFTLLGDGARSFRLVGGLSSIFDVRYAGSIDLLDANGDGLVDLVRYPFVAEGDGTGRFPEPRTVGAERAIRQSPGDFDADGVLDLAVFLDSFRLAVAAGDGAGGFASEPVSIGPRVTFRGLAARDVDRDAHSDVVFVAAETRDAGAFAQTLVDRTRGLCLAGTVGAGDGRLAGVLFVNEATGGATRRVRVAIGAPIRIEMTTPPGATRPARFALYAWTQALASADRVTLPFFIGCTALPTPLTGGFPQPGAVWNNTGRAALGSPTLPSVPAPSIVWERPAGIGRPARFLLQGIVEDASSAGTRPASATNGVVVDVRG